MFKYIVIGCIIVYLIIFLVLCYKSKQFLKTLILNIFIGIISLVILSLLSSVTGVQFNINRITGLTSAAFGIPGILMLFALNYIF